MASGPDEEPARPSFAESGAEFASVSSETSKRPFVGGIARHTLGIILLLTTVFLWTASQFLASTIFADDTYSKPYFVTYVNSSFFAFLLVPISIKYILIPKGPLQAFFRHRERFVGYAPLVDGDGHVSGECRNHDEPSMQNSCADSAPEGGSSRILRSLRGKKGDTSAKDRMDLRETTWLSLEFSILWFVANYFTAACLEYTSVSSSTILTSTSSIWTLLIGACLGVENFTLKKLIGVFACFAGVVLTSGADISGDNDKNRGSFPHKSGQQISIGDALALLSAVLYGIYTTLMKKRIGDEARVNMVLFFGLVGLFNIVTLLPGFLVFHYTGVEPFELPPTKRIWAIILINSAASLMADFCWAYSMLLTSPLVVTVGLSLTIPLSMVGQIMLNSQTSSGMYWMGAGVVFLSFLFVNHESKQEAPSS